MGVLKGVQRSLRLRKMWDSDIRLKNNLLNKQIIQIIFCVQKNIESLVIFCVSLLFVTVIHGLSEIKVF